MTASSYRVQARNLSHASENKIHDDDVARRFGFQGGLVPGVEVYAYMTHVAVMRWGIDWLERGSAECRFLKPVYDGKMVNVSGSEADGVLSISVESEGQRCATGSASLREPPPAPALPQAAPLRALEERPPADEASLGVGRRMSSQPLDVTPERLTQYIADIGETEPLYAREKLVHPALVLRLCNSALKENVKLGPWIHAGSAVQHYALARAGESLTAHATVAANYERNGHRLVDLDVLVTANGTRVVARVRHTAIYRLASAVR